MHRPSRGWREEGELFGPGWLEEAFGLRPDREESPAPRPSEPERTNAEVEEYRDLLQRLQADFVNYKRRVEREREEQTKSANRELILKLLPIMDDFARALGPVPQEMADAEWVKGIALIQQKLMATLEEEGLKRIDAEGKHFDPWEHEALFCEGSSDDDEGKVKAVIRDGYKLHDRVIRPAQVVVSKASEQGEPIAS
ncbi:MAG: nucleotide exchange factor GrpE [Dehalococcoidia bacterium]